MDIQVETADVYKFHMAADNLKIQLLILLK